MMLQQKFTKALINLAFNYRNLISFMENPTGKTLYDFIYLFIFIFFYRPSTPMNYVMGIRAYK